MSDRSVNNRGVNAGAVRVLYALVAASVLIPILMFAADGYLTWRATVASAHDNLRRDVIIVAEHATRLLDAHVMTAGRVSDLIRDLDDQQIIANEGAIHDRLAALARHLPQVGDIVVLDATGHPLISTQRYPSNRSQDFSDQGFFRTLRDHIQTVVIAGSISGAAGNNPGFIVAVRRGRLGSGFRGVIVVKGAPGSFEMFDRWFLQDNVADEAGLYRTDGATISHYPNTAGDAAPQLLMGRIANVPLSGIVRGSDAVDGTDRLMAYRRLESYPAYAMASRPWNAITAQWRSTMMRHLGFGIPALLGLAVLGFLTVHRVARESIAFRDTRAELGRREAAEITLRQSQKLEAFGQLTGGLARDFNDHLTAIGDRIEMLRHHLADGHEGLVRLTDAAMLAVRRAATLTHRLMVFSRQKPLEPEPLDAGRLIVRMMDTLRGILPPDVAIKTNATPELWLTCADAGQLESTLVHLVLNAGDAMPQGGMVSICPDNASFAETRIAGGARVPAGDYVRITVKDTGRGMEPEAIAKICEPFGSTKFQNEGHDLGLSAVCGFVRQAGGHIEIASASGQGTTITLLLPRHSTPPVLSRVASPAKRVSWGRETILVVEDDADERRAAAVALRRAGYDVLEARDAMEAFRLIADRGGIDLLFTDIGLPGGVNGRALADAARNVSTALKVLFTTGYDLPADAGDDGVDVDVHFLAKPFDFRQLLSTVRSVLDDEPTFRERASEAEPERA